MNNQDNYNKEDTKVLALFWESTLEGYQELPVERSNQTIIEENEKSPILESLILFLFVFIFAGSVIASDCVEDISSPIKERYERGLEESEVDLLIDIKNWNSLFDEKTGELYPHTTRGHICGHSLMQTFNSLNYTLSMINESLLGPDKENENFLKSLNENTLIQASKATTFIHKLILDCMDGKDITQYIKRNQMAKFIDPILGSIRRAKKELKSSEIIVGKKRLSYYCYKISKNSNKSCFEPSREKVKKPIIHRNTTSFSVTGAREI